MSHPGDLRFSELDATDQEKLLLEWGTTAREMASMFNAMSAPSRWEAVCAARERTGEYQEEVNQIAANVDSATTEEFEALLPHNPLFPQSPDGWPTLHEAALRGLPGDVVRRILPHTEADPAALLLTFLAVFGAAVGRGPHAMADGSSHAGRLFVVVVGDSAKARKGTSWAQARRILEIAAPGFTKERIAGGFGSGEALVDSVAEGEDGRLMVVEPEWARVLSVGKRDGATLSQILRQAWDGDRLAVRSRSDTATADGAHIAVLGHITTEELRAKLVDTEVANGFANRHLFVLAKRSQLLPHGGNLSQEDLAELGRLTRDAITAASRVGRLERTAEAEALWERLYYEMAEDNPGGLLGSVIARDSAQQLRLSVLYALCDGSSTIEVDHVMAAAAVWSYCRQSAASIFGESLGNPLADKILGLLVDAGAVGLDARELDRALGGHVHKPEKEAAISALKRKSLVVSRTEKTGGRDRVVLVVREHAEEAEEAEEAPTAEHAEEAEEVSCSHNPDPQPLSEDQLVDSLVTKLGATTDISVDVLAFDRPKVNGDAKRQAER